MNKVMGAADNCTICDVYIPLECRYPIFESCSTHSGSSLKDLLQNVTKSALQIENLNSYVCKRCFKLLEQLDYSTVSVAEIKKEIQHYLHKNYGIHSYQSFVEVACQTEEVLSYVNANFVDTTANGGLLEEEYSFKCNICNKQFKNPGELVQHGELCGTKKHKCEFCGSNFTTKTGLNSHKKKHKVTIKVEVSKLERNRDEGAEKLDLVHDSEKKSLNTNGKKHKLATVKLEVSKFENETESQFHEMLEPIVETREDDFHYDVFDDGYNTPDDTAYSEHMPDNTPDTSKRKAKVTKSRRKPIEANDSEDDKPLSQHRKEIIDKNIRAEINSDFENNSSDSENKLTNTDVNPPIKRKGRPKRGQAPTATDFITNVRPLIFECTECPKKWRTKSELKIHMNSHSTARSHVCEICGQAYKKKHALDIHLGMHNGINPFTCNRCGKVFTQKGALTRHLPIHTGEKNYQCDLCGKRFIHHTSFSMHAITHSGVKAYKCEVCGLGLMSQSHLKRHMRAHSGEKKYACSQCGKRFAERYNLSAHERLHFAPNDKRRRVHSCPVCSDTFPRRAKLEEHLAMNHHKIVDSEDSRKWAGTMLNQVGNLVGNETPWPAFPQTETIYPMVIKPEQLEQLTDSNEMNSS